MSTTTAVAVVLVDDPLRTEAIAVAGFLAGYCGSTRRSYATDLRLFSAWCHEAKLPVFSVRRAHLEVSRQTVNAIENGRYDPSLPLAFRIAEVFARPIEEIFHP